LPNFLHDIETNKDEEINTTRAGSVSELSSGPALPCGSEILPKEAHQQLPSPTQFYEPRLEYRSPTPFDLGFGTEGHDQTLFDSQNSLGLAMGDYESNFELPFFGLQQLDHQLGEISNSIQTQEFGVTPKSIVQSSGSIPQDENSSAMSMSTSHLPSLPNKTSHPSEDQQRQSRRFTDIHGFSDLPGGLFDELQVFLIPSTYLPRVANILYYHRLNIWFDKIQSFLPLLHRPRFLDTISNFRDGEGLVHRNIDWEICLLLNAMFAMAARFSDSPYFAGKPFPERGERFARRAKRLYESSLPHLRAPTLIYLQGLTVLAFYLYAMEPNPQGWVLIGICSRLAYELELDKIDEDPKMTKSQMTQSEEWSRQEERRRTWWCIWELDGFAAAIACRRPTIDKRNMQIMLPVSDETWFSNTPVESAIIDPSPTKAWQTLGKCENQDVRAWFLIANFLLLSAHDLAQSKGSSKQDVNALETAVSCFFLMMPSEFNLSSLSLSFTDRTYRRSNWIISMNIMLQGYDNIPER
jgi:hypothetical protein